MDWSSLMSFPGSDFDDLLRPREVAELLGVRTATVARWAREGLIKPFTRTPGGHRRYRRGEVLALREGNSTDARSCEERQMEEDAARLYVQGWTIRRVAAEFECSYGKMRRILAKQVILRNRGGRTPGTFDS
jgi:excisionase family DNA binding protein